MARSDCPVSQALDVFGDRWTLLVVRDLLLKGRRFYGEFLEAGEGISTNILADRLKKLQDEGIVIKERDPDNHARFIYTPTARGRDLLPVLLQMMRWSGKHRDTAMPSAYKRKLEHDFDAVLRGHLDKLDRDT